MFTGKLSLMLVRLHSRHFIIQFVAAANGLGIPPTSTMRIQRVSEFVMTFVGMRIGPFRRAQQRKTQHVALHVVSILAVVKQAEAVFTIGKIGPALRWHFELGLLGRCIASCWAFDRAAGNLKCGLLAVRAERESYLQQNMFLMPVGLHLHVDSGNASVHRDVLYER